jgi:Peptidase family M50
LLWIFGGLFVLPAATQFWLMAVMSDPDAEVQRDFAMVLFGLYSLASALALVSAFAMRRAAKWARPVCWIAATVQVFAVPMFTPLGLFGLILLARGAAREGTLVARPTAPAKKGAIASTVVALVPLLLVIDLGFRWARMLGYPEATRFPVVLAVLFTCIALQLVVHEGGHALAAIAMHGHIHRFQVGPISWTRESAHTQTKFLKKMQFGGMVCWTPGHVHRLAQ